MYRYPNNIKNLINAHAHIGIEEQIPYFKDTGIGAVWLSPIFKSPMFDMGYDISNFMEIDTIFGTMDDFVSLQKKLKANGWYLL